MFTVIPTVVEESQISRLPACRQAGARDDKKRIRDDKKLILILR